MMNFIKPNFLGSTADFAEFYANPIRHGQHKDSTAFQVQVMKQKSYVLHKKLSRYVQVSGPMIGRILWKTDFILPLLELVATRCGHSERFHTREIRIRHFRYDDRYPGQLIG